MSLCQVFTDLVTCIVVLHCCFTLCDVILHIAIELLKNLFERVVAGGHAPQWESLGILLEVEKSILDEIEYNCGRRCRKCCIHVLSHWLDNDTDASVEKFDMAIQKLNTQLHGEFFVVLCAKFTGFHLVLGVAKIIIYQF